MLWLTLLALFVPEDAAAWLNRWFNGAAQPHRQTRTLEADFNGDAKPDAVALATRGPNLPTGVTLLNPWSSAPARRPKPGAAVFAVVIAGPQPSRYLLGDSEILSTPIWKEAKPADLLHIVKRAKAPRGSKGDAIAVATEAGIDVYLYFDGKTWRVETPNEEP